MERVSKPRKLTAGWPQNDGPWNAGGLRLKKIAIFGINSLDFWGVRHLDIYFAHFPCEPIHVGYLYGWTPLRPKVLSADFRRLELHSDKALVGWDGMEERELGDVFFLQKVGSLTPSQSCERLTMHQFQLFVQGLKKHGTHFGGIMATQPTFSEIPSLKLTWPLKIGHPKRKLVFSIPAIYFQVLC